MNYELAKKLKDAGFVFKEWYLECHNGESSELKWDNADWEYPTLSELIEACGKEIDTIERVTSGWRASGSVEDIELGYVKIEEIGSTIEEAVANLFLSILGENVKV
jgi:hypothetical protein